MPAQLAVAVELEHAEARDRGVPRGGEQPQSCLKVMLATSQAGSTAAT